jgi:hypothetical protein
MAQFWQREKATSERCGESDTGHKGGIMNKALGLGLLAVGIILLVMGFNASQSAGSEISKFFTGSPTDKAMWMLVGGAFAAVAGGVLVARSRN